jgi:hypothetical protein
MCEAKQLLLLVLVWHFKAACVQKWGLINTNGTHACDSKPTALKCARSSVHP